MSFPHLKYERVWWATFLRILVMGIPALFALCVGRVLSWAETFLEWMDRKLPESTKLVEIDRPRTPTEEDHQ